MFRDRDTICDCENKERNRQGVPIDICNCGGYNDFHKKGPFKWLYLHLESPTKLRAFLLVMGEESVQLGLTWPLQRVLKVSVPYGNPVERGMCWDAHCITLHGRSCLLLVHCESRYTCVRFDLTPIDWSHLGELVQEEILKGLLDAGIAESRVARYMEELGAVHMTRTHGRREVAFLNRAWEDVLSADVLVDQTTHRQPVLNCVVNARLCRCAGEDGLDTAQAHLERYFIRKYNGKESDS